MVKLQCYEIEIVEQNNQKNQKFFKLEAVYQCYDCFDFATIVLSVNIGWFECNQSIAWSKGLFGEVAHEPKLIIDSGGERISGLIWSKLGHPDEVFYL